MATLKSIFNFLFGRRYRHADNERREQFLTVANVLTLLRAAAASTIFVIAILSRSHTLLLIGLAVSMVLDFVDGIVARERDRETILGAQLDGAADRIAAGFVAAGMISLHGDATTVVAAVAVSLQFGVVDGLLAAQFLRFGLWSPDHFYEIHERVWRLNWSAVAKLASNLPIALLALGGDARWAALGLAIMLIAIRIPSYVGVRERARALLEEENYARRPFGESAEAPPEPAADSPARHAPEDLPAPRVPPLIAR